MTEVDITSVQWANRWVGYFLTHALKLWATTEIDAVEYNVIFKKIVNNYTKNDSKPITIYAFTNNKWFSSMEKVYEAIEYYKGQEMGNTVDYEGKKCFVPNLKKIV